MKKTKYPYKYPINDIHVDPDELVERINKIPYQRSPLVDGRSSSWSFKSLFKLMGKSEAFSEEANQAINLYEKKYKRRIFASDSEDLEAIEKAMYD